MHFKLIYSGSADSLSCSLVCDGVTIATTSGLADKKAAQRWAQREARDHKVVNTPEATEFHSVSISGSKTFSL